MFHYNNFGGFGNQLKRFADLAGYVPEEGDELGRFGYPNGWFDDAESTPDEIEDEWREYVAAAVSATQAAEAELEDWRDNA